VTRVEALKAFHEVIDSEGQARCLSDPCRNEKFEAIPRGEALGKDCTRCGSTPRRPAVATSPHPRGGPLGVDIRGFEHVKILASGGIDE